MLDATEDSNILRNGLVEKILVSLKSPDATPTAPCSNLCYKFMTPYGNFFLILFSQLSSGRTEITHAFCSFFFRTVLHLQKNLEDTTENSHFSSPCTHTISAVSNILH